VLIGDRRKFLTAIKSSRISRSSERDAAALGIQWSSRKELVRSDQVKALYQGELERSIRTSNGGEDPPPSSRSWTNDFTIENDEITPSLKASRKVIDKKYKDVMRGMYIDENVD